MQHYVHLLVLGHHSPSTQTPLSVSLNLSSKENQQTKMIIRVLVAIDYKCLATNCHMIKPMDLLPHQLAQILLVAGTRRDDYQNVLMTRSGSH